ncbi:phage tail tape measure protein [Lachnospiraceae bacterium AM48-27BH]|nr:phage tail tape measure protein [Lachnospiraceae bacterium AM48-27BH]
MSNVDISLSAGLSIEESYEQIRSDIAQIQKRLDAAGIKINLTAEVDTELKKSLEKLGNTKEPAVVGKKLGDVLASNIINEFSIKSKDAQRQIKTYMGQIYNMTVGELKTGNDNPQLLNVFNQLGEVVKNNANILQSRMGIYDSFYQYFKGINKIKIPDVVRTDLGKDWNSMRLTSAKTFTTGNGIELDSIYQEMSSKFKDLFSGTTDQTQQFREIVTALRAYRADVDKLEPIDPAKVTGFEDSVWDSLVSNLGVLRNQIKAQLPEIEAEVERSAENIKKSLLDIDVSFDGGDVSKLTEEAKNYFKSISGIEDKDINLQFFKNANEDITSFNATIDRGQGILEKYSFSMNNLGQYVYNGGSIIDKSGKEFSEVTVKAAEFQSKLESLKSTYNDFLSGTSAENPFKALVEGIDFNNITDKESLDTMAAKFRQATEMAKAFNTELSQSGAGQKLSQYLKELPADIDYLEEKFRGANFKIPDDVAQSFRAMREQITQIEQTSDPSKKIQLYNQLTDQLNKVTQKYKQMALEEKNAANNTKLQANKNLFSTNLDTWMNKNTSAAKVFSERLADIKSRLASADATEFTHLENEFKAIQSEATQMGLTGSNAVKAMKSEFDRAVTSVVSLTAAFHAFKRMVSTAKELDDSLFNLQVATGKTREETKGLLDTYNQMAGKLGATTEQVAEAANDWLRTGRSLDETNELIKDSMILSKIGMIDTGDATQYLVSALNGYKLSAESALEVISKLSNVDMNAAVSAGGIAEAMSRTATSADQAGVSIDRLIGMIATMKDVSQASDERVGTAIKSIVSRYSQVKTNKLVDYESGEDLSNVEKALKKVGVQIRDNLTDFRDLDDVLGELAKKYNDLNDVEKNGIATALFGTQQGEMGKVLLSNWDKVQELTKISADSSTEALDKFSAYTDTLQAHINSLTASYEHLASVVADSEFLKGAADAASGFLDVISAVTDKLGVLSVATGAITGGAALKGVNLGLFGNNGADITFLGKTVQEMEAASAAGEKFGGIFTKSVKEPIVNAQSVIANYNKLAQKQAVSQQAINNLTDDFNMRKYLSGLKGAEAGMEGYTASFKMSEAATLRLKLETVALNMALNMAITAGITAAIWAIGKAYDTVANRVKNLRESAEESAQTYEDLKSDIENINDEMKTTASRIDELNKKDHLSFVEQEELQKLKDTNEELERQLKNKQALANAEKDEAREKALKYFNSYADVQPTRYLGWDMSQVEAKNERYGHVEGGVYTGNQAEVAMQQAKDYLALLEEQKQVEKDILEFQMNHPQNYENMDEYQNLIQHGNALKSQIDVLKTSVTEFMTDFSKLDSSLDPEKDQALLSLITEFSNLYQQIFSGGETPTQSFDDVWNSNSFQSAKTELEKMAKAGTLDQKTLSNNEKYKELLDATGKTAKETCDHIYSLVEAEGETGTSSGKPFSKQEMISQINGLSEGFEELDKIMNSMKDTKSPFDYSILDDKKFNDNFSKLGDAYTDFVEKIASSPKDVKGCQSAFDNLATAFVNNSGILNGLSEDTATLTTDMLKNMGVANAEEVVMAALGQKKAAAAAETKNLADMSDEEIDAFLTEQGATADTIDAFKAYVAEKQLANFAIDPNGDIEALNAIMVKLGAAGNAWKNYYRYKKDLDAINNGEVYTVAGTKMYKYTDVDGRTHHISENGKKQLEDLTSSQYNSVMNELKTGSDLKLAHYSGGPKTNKESSSGSSKKENKEEKETFDWTERKLEIIANQHDKINDYISNETKSIEGQQAALSEIISLDQQKMEVLKQQIEVYKQYWLKALSEIDEEQLKIYGNGMSKDDLISKITNGSLDIQDFVLPEGATDAQETAYKKLVEGIKNAQSAYQDVEDTEKKLDDTEQDIADHQKERYEKRIEQIEAENDALKSRQDIIQADLDLLEASGGIELEGMYQELIDLSKQQMSLYEEEAAAARDRMSEVEAGSTEYYQLESKINDCTQSIKECQKEQAEWQETIKRLPIERIQKYINMLQNIKQDLQNFIDEQNSLGISTTVDQYKQLMDICQKEIDKLLEQQKKLSDLLGTYQYGSEKFNDVQDEIQDINDTISGLIQNMYEWNNSIMQIPIDQLSKVNEQLNLYSNSLGEVLDNYDSVLSAVTGTIDQQIQSLEDLKTATEKSYEKQTKPIEEKISLLQRENEARSKQISLEEAQYNLEKARNQKNVQVVKNGSLTYIADEESIRQAQSDLSEAKYNKIVFDLQNEVDRLNDEKNKLLENYDQQIEKLQTVEDKWSKIKDQIQLAADTIKATDLFGADWQNKILSGKDDDLYTMFKNLYESTSTEKDKVDEQIASNERIVTMMQRFVELYQDGSITYEKAMAGITQMATQMKDGYSALEQLNGLMNLDGIGKISDISASTNAKVDESVQLLGEYMGIAKANSDTISQYTSTWNEMKDNIAAQLAQLEKMAKELEEYVKNHTYSSGSSSSSRDHDSGSSSPSGGGSGNNYVAAGPGYSDEGMQEAINRGDRIEFDGSGGGKTEQEIKDTYEEMTKNKRHTGVEKGPVGSNGDSNDKYAKLAKELGLKEIQPYEYPAFLKEGEIVFTPEQQKQLVDNMKIFTSTPKYMTVPENVIKKNQQVINIDCSMGDVTLPNVQNCDQFIKHVSTQWVSSMRQQLSVVCKN